MNARRTTIALAATAILALPLPATAAPVPPAVWWIVPRAATITNGDYPRPTAWTLDGVEYGVADNGHLYADGADLGVPCAPVVTPAPKANPQVTRLRAKNKALRAQVRRLRAALRGAR